MVGASLAWLMYGTIIYLLLVPRLVRACLGSTLSAWFRRNARLVPSLLVFALGWVCLQSFGPDRIPSSRAASSRARLQSAPSFVFVGPELRGTVLAGWTGVAVTPRSQGGFLMQTRIELLR